MASKKLIPLLDRVLVEKLSAPTKSVGGILLPEAASKLMEGRVLAVGPGRRLMNGEVAAPGVKEGDKVLLPEFGGMPIKMDGKDLTLYRDEELLGILKDN